MKSIVATVCCFILFCLPGLAEAQVSAYGTAARVNGAEISNADLERNFEEYQRNKNINIAAIRYPNRVTMMRQEVLDGLIIQEVLWQAAQEKQLIAKPAKIDNAMQQARAQFDSELDYISRLATEGFTPDSYRLHLKKVLSAKMYLATATSNIEVDDNECHDFYVANPGKFQLPEAVRARHILLKLTPQDDEETKNATIDKAVGILDRLLAGADFAEIARKESQDRSAGDGGDLGYFPRGKMDRKFEDAAFALQPGEISGIVETPFGLHIIKVEDHQQAQTVPETVAKERIKEHLLKVKQQQAATSTIAALRAAATIEVVAPR